MTSTKNTETTNYLLAQQLLYFSAKGNLHEVLKLLKQGATVAVNKHGRTALHISSHRGYLDIARVLLQAGCPTDIQDDNGDTALHRAVVSGRNKIVQRLLEEACDIDRQNNVRIKLGDTALHEAARNGHSTVLKLLLHARANIYCKNENDDIPLHMASANGHSSSTLLLLHAGSPHSAFNKQKDTPLHLAVRFGHSSCAKLLLAATCNLNSQNEFGNTALHVATVSLQFKLVRILLDSHAEAQNVKNNDGKSPVDLAKDMNNGELVLMLISGARSKGRCSSRSAHRRRSHSESRVVSRRKSSSEECQAALSLKRSPERIKVKRRSSHRSSVRKSCRRSVPEKALEEHQNDLVVNPYVVPQLYSLYRDDKGNIGQVPVLDRLPNPTPQIVEQIHQSIKEVRDGWQQSLQQVQTSFNEKLQELRNETDHRLRSIDKLTLQRLSAERTECLHRIDRQMACERLVSEDKSLDELKQWVESRLQKLEGIARCLSSPLDTQSSGNSNAKPSTPIHSGEVEERSVDSGVVGSYTVGKPPDLPVSQFVELGTRKRFNQRSMASSHSGTLSAPRNFEIEHHSGVLPPSLIQSWHSTPYDIHSTQWPRFSALPRGSQYFQPNLRNYGILSASCDNLTSPGFYTHSGEGLTEKKFSYDLKGRQLTPYDCNVDGTSITNRLAGLTWRSACCLRYIII